MILIKENVAGACQNPSEVCMETLKGYSTFYCFILWGNRCRLSILLTLVINSLCSEMVFILIRALDHHLVFVIWTQSRGKNDPEKPDFSQLVEKFGPWQDFSVAIQPMQKTFLMKRRLNSPAS